jgi:hypothetical protein
MLISYQLLAFRSSTLIACMNLAQFAGFPPYKKLLHATKLSNEAKKHTHRPKHKLANHVGYLFSGHMAGMNTVKASEVAE